MKWKLFFTLILLIEAVSASGVTCTIVDEKVLVEVELTDGASVILPEEYSLLEESENRVSFISRDFLRKDGEWIFVLPRVVDSVYDLKVYLPQGHILVNDLVYPKGYDISSDGSSIILEWKDFDESEALVFYESLESSYFWFWLLIFVLVGLGVGVRYFEKKRFFEKLEKMKKSVVKGKVSKKKLVSLNLFGEEKKIVEFLMTKKGRSCWGKELVRELGMSKVMASRKVRSLVEKKIVAVEKMGREMKISLVGK